MSDLYKIWIIVCSKCCRLCTREWVGKEIIGVRLIVTLDNLLCCRCSKQQKVIGGKWVCRND